MQWQGLIAENGGGQGKQKGPEPTIGSLAAAVVLVVSALFLTAQCPPTPGMYTVIKAGNGSQAAGMQVHSWRA